MSGFGVVAVRGPVRALLGGPYDEIDARYHAKRLKETSPDQDYIVVPYHECRQCQALSEPGQMTENYPHTCSSYYDKAEAV